ncbi:MAG: lipoate protein ligase C-terminal domain-containing protein [Anaerolineales bacterium]
MDLYNLGTRPWQDTQSIYHALAHLGREALCLVEPASPYVCLGFHQDAAKELDLEYIAREGIPLFRREVGGGAVYLDRGQLFYQFILRKDDPRLPSDKAELFKFILQPVIDTYREFGVPAEYKPVNDILAGGKKISGNGAAEIQERVVVVGNFLLDFNFEQMARVLRVPDEKFRDKVFKTLQENLTTIPRETGKPAPSIGELSAGFIRRCEALFGRLFPRKVDGELRKQADALAAVYSTPDWVMENDRREQAGREVKIAEGVSVLERVAKLPGGLVRMSAVNANGKLRDIHLSGDFFFFPAARLEDLERALEGVEIRIAPLEERIAWFFRTYGVSAPGIQPEALAKVICAA